MANQRYRVFFRSIPAHARRQMRSRLVDCLNADMTLRHISSALNIAERDVQWAYHYYKSVAKALDRAVERQRPGMMMAMKNG